jgi:AhpD family alkylhydroperoxidase
MRARFHYFKAAPGAYQAMLGLEQYLHSCGLEAPLIHLVKLRASQMNGCAFCIDMHWKDLFALGEPVERLLASRRPSPWLPSRSPRLGSSP